MAKQTRLTLEIGPKGKKVVAIAPEDFPFLAQIRGHDDARLEEYATALPTGAPWPGDL